MRDDPSGAMTQTGFSGPAVHPPAKMRLAAFASLRNRDFRWFWLGMLAAFNSMQMQMVARGWLVYTMTDSAMALGTVTAGFGVPMILFSLYGGAVADRVRKRNLLLFTRAGTAAISLIVTVLIAAQKIALWHLVAAAILSGAFMSFNLPGRQAFVLELMGRDSLLNAIAMNSMAMNICRIASPAIAGVLLKLIGIPGVYWIITGSNIVVVWTLAMIPAGEPKGLRSETPLIGDVIEGLRYVGRQGTILALLVISFVPIVVAMPYQMLMPVFARTVFRAGETGLGLLMSAVGLGALSGSMILASLGNYRHKGVLMLAAGAVFGLFLILFGLSGSLGQAFVSLLFVGAGSSMYMALNNTLVMSNTPTELVGRVMSLSMMTFGLMPLAMLPAGAVAESVGAPLTVLGGGVILLVSCAGAVLVRPGLAKLT